MMQLKTWFGIITLSLVITQTFAQGDKWWSEYHYFRSTSIEKTSLWGSFDYSLKSNTLSNKLINEAAFKGKIEKETAALLLSEDPNSTTYLAGGAISDLWFRNASSGNWNLLVGFGTHDMVYSKMKTGLAQLYLNGNAPFEDTDLPLGPSWLKYMSYQFLGIGTEYATEKVIWGISGQLIKTSRYQEFQMDESSLYTAPNGTYLDATLNFDYWSAANKQAKAAAWYGTGASLNSYLIFHPSPTGGLLSFQLNDLGFTTFQGVNSYSLEKDSLITGYQIQNILALDDAVKSSANLDSLQALLGLESSHSGRTVMLPGRITLDFVQPLKEHFSLAMRVKQYLLLTPPELRAGLQWTPSNSFGIEPYVRIGGFSKVDYGISLTTQLKKSLQIILKYELIESQINRTNSSGQAFCAGGQFLF